MIKTKMVWKRLCLFENFCEEEKIVRKNEGMLHRFRLALCETKCNFISEVISLSWLFHHTKEKNSAILPTDRPFF